jgi:hypothetical protein
MQPYQTSLYKMTQICPFQLWLWVHFVRIAIFAALLIRAGSTTIVAYRPADPSETLIA